MIRFAKVSLLLALSLAGCGGGSSGSSATASGVATTKHIPALTDAEKGTICDWFVGKVGGYGATSSCDQATLNAPANKAECTTQFPSCDVTVSDFEGCVNAMVAAQTTCTEAAFNDAVATPACMAAAVCFSQA
jgi:hypothetical protein